MSTRVRAIVTVLVATFVALAGSPCGATLARAEGDPAGVTAGWWTHGPWGGQVNALVMEPERTLYAATYDSGVFRSLDGGQTWAAASAGLSDQPVTQLAPGGAFLYAVAGGRLFISTDRAGSWSVVATPLDMVVELLAVSPSFAADRTLYIGGHRTERESALRHALVYRSQTGGDTWALAYDKMEGGSATYALLALVVSPVHGRDGRLWIVQQEVTQLGPHFNLKLGLHVSANRGRTWRELHSEICYSRDRLGVATAFLAISPAYALDGTLHYSVRYDARPGYFCAFQVLSTDAGATWAPTDWPLPVAFSPVYDQDELIYSPMGRSPDGGATWEETLIPWPLAFSPAFGADGTCYAPGAWSQDRGATWLPAHSAGLSDLDVSAVTLSPGWSGDGIAFAATEGGIYRSDDRGQSWKRVARHPAHILIISPGFAQDGTLWAAAAEATYGSWWRHDSVYRSTDGGDTWLELPCPEQRGRIIGMAVSPGFPQDRTLFLARYDDLGESGNPTHPLYRSQDGGDTWSMVGPLQGQMPLASWNAASLPGILVISGQYASDGIVMVACQANGLLFSEDGGAHWAGKTPPNPGGTSGLGEALPAVGASAEPLPPDARLVSLSPDYGRDGIIWLDASDGLWRSEDDGASWKRSTAPGAVTSLVPSPRYSADAVLMAGTADQGVRFSLSAGASWFALTEGLGSLESRGLALADSGELEVTVLDATPRGLWQGTLTMQPQSLSLAQGQDGYAAMADTYLNAWFPQQPYGTQGKMVIRGDGAARPLLRFGLAEGEAPVDLRASRVETASLELYVNWGAPVQTFVDLYPVIRRWDENQARWSEAKADTSWSVWGCDGAGSDRGSAPGAGGIIRAAEGFVRFDVRDLVESWLRVPGSNQGLLLIGRDAPGGSQYDLLSSEHWDASKRPRLNLEMVHAMDASTPTPTATWTASPTPANTRTPTATTTRASTGTATPTASWTPTLTRPNTATPTATVGNTSIGLPLLLRG